jgi:hypothetical protein
VGVLGVRAVANANRIAGHGARTAA